VERDLAVAGLAEDTVEHDEVVVGVHVEGGAEPVEEADGSELGISGCWARAPEGSSTNRSLGGGPRAGEVGGGLWGRSRWSRMAATTGGSVRKARMFIWLPQAGHSSGSTS